MKKPIDYRMLLLQFIGSLTLCDHMGDVADDVNEVMKRMGVKIKWDDWSDLGKSLHKLGVATLYGTELGSEESE
jgi:hypothetical protein